MTRIDTGILDTALDPAAALARLAGADLSAGGVASFLGQVRQEDGLMAVRQEGGEAAGEKEECDGGGAVITVSNTRRVGQ